MRRLAVLERDRDAIRDLWDRYVFLKEFQEIGDSALDESFVAETASLAEEARVLAASHRQRDPWFDRAAILCVHAGTGGLEAQDFARMLLASYLAWASRERLDVDTLDFRPGEQSGLLSATISVRGAGAFGRLRGEAGVFRLQRMSPYDSRGRRHTSFASVDVIPESESSEESFVVKIEELEITTLRGSGKGGQNRNKVETAVRVRHVPTGLTVRCESERTQAQNKRNALLILRSKLEERARSEEALRIQSHHQGKPPATWGRHRRTIVLAPDERVTDHITGMTSPAASQYIRGDIDDFLTAS